jgi:hypothetical protein
VGELDFEALALVFPVRALEDQVFELDEETVARFQKSPRAPLRNAELGSEVRELDIRVRELGVETLERLLEVRLLHLPVLELQDEVQEVDVQVLELDVLARLRDDRVPEPHVQVGSDDNGHFSFRRRRIPRRRPEGEAIMSSLAPFPESRRSPRRSPRARPTPTSRVPGSSSRSSKSRRARRTRSGRRSSRWREIRISKASRGRKGREKRGRNASYEQVSVVVPLALDRRSILADSGHRPEVPMR